MRTQRAEILRAADELRAHNWTIEVVETARGGDAIHLAREAAAQRLDALIAVGGDGTLNEVANGLVDAQTALGTLPSGTANVWAREMGLPIGDAVAAARRLADADICAIDVGEVRALAVPPSFARKIRRRLTKDERAGAPRFAPRVFVLWCGVGFDAAITRQVEPQREIKRRLGALAFILVGLREAWSYRGKRATLVIGNKRLRRRVFLALASNAQLYGGIVRIAPNATVDDGLLDFVVFKGTGIWTTVWHLAKVFFGRHLGDPQVEAFALPSVQVIAKGLPVHVDAEPIGTSPVEIRVRPRALRVLVPKTANRNLFTHA
jgi:YegS/Rv2252/BmrU family lipid kinase